MEGVKKSEYRPSPYPLPPGERVNIMKQERNSLPLEGGGEGGGVLGDYFTASGGDLKAGKIPLSPPLSKGDS